MTERAADARADQNADMDGEAYDASTALIHDDHDPVASQEQRLAAKEIQAPEAILRVTEKSQPGNAARRSPPKMLGDPAAAESRVSALHVKDGCGELSRWAFGSRLSVAIRRARALIFSVHLGPMESHDGRWLQDDGRAKQPGRAHESGAHPRNHSVNRTETGARSRERLRIDSCCLSRSDSATTERAPPGRMNLAIVASRWMKSKAMSRVPASWGSKPVLQDLDFPRIRATNREFATDTSPHHLHWPALDIDLAVESIRHPEKFPLASRPDT